MSYSGDPSTSATDEVRFWVQDTDTANELLTDAEIDYLLAKWGEVANSVLFTAAVACEVIAAKYTPDVDVSADGVAVSVGQLQERYLRLAVRLREQYKAEAAAGAEPITSGVMWSDGYDSTIKPLRFGVGHMDNYEAGRQDYGDYDTSKLAWYSPGAFPWLEINPTAAGLLGR